MKGQALGKGQLFDALDGAAHVFPKQMAHDVGGIDAKRHFWKITTTVQNKPPRGKRSDNSNMPTINPSGPTLEKLHKHPYH
jgi:hypothetical protein